MINELNYEGIEFPVSQKHYNKIEKQNSIRINVFGYENGQPFPIHISKEIFEDQMNLLLITKDEKKHYVLIKDFNAFMYNQSKHKERKHFCMYCLQCFSFERILANHVNNCLTINGAQAINMPKQGENILKFNNFHKQLQVPFVIYADFEAITKKVQGFEQNEEMKEYDEKEPSKYIMYLDANSLYGWAVSQYLPTGNLKWMTDKEISKIDLGKYKTNGKKGLILDVDLEYPQELHDMHNDYPVCPEKVKVSKNMLSAYCKKIA